MYQPIREATMSTLVKIRGAGKEAGDTVSVRLDERIGK
jgi:hypothetical protein